MIPRIEVGAFKKAEAEIQKVAEQMVLAGGATNTSEETQAASHKQNTKQDIGRNDPCYCGSGKKYKKCHGKDE